MKVQGIRLKFSCQFSILIINLEIHKNSKVERMILPNLAFIDWRVNMIGLNSQLYYLPGNHQRNEDADSVSPIKLSLNTSPIIE